jgi:hypothetical protein
VFFCCEVRGSFVAPSAILKNPQIRTGMRADRRYRIGGQMPDLAARISRKSSPHFAGKSRS